MEQQKTISQNEPDINANENPAPVSDAMFRVLTEAAASAILIYQEDVFRYLNHAMEVISGYSRQELFAMNTWDIVHPEDLEMVIAPGVNQDHSLRCRAHSQTSTWYEFSRHFAVTADLSTGRMRVTQHDFSDGGGG